MKSQEGTLCLPLEVSLQDRDVFKCRELFDLVIQVSLRQELNHLAAVQCSQKLVALPLALLEVL